jgi:hypothetical protein
LKVDAYTSRSMRRGSRISKWRLQPFQGARIATKSTPCRSCLIAFIRPGGNPARSGA